MRAGKTIAGEEVAALIRSFKKYLPGCVKRVILRGDGEFISWEAVKAAGEEEYDFIFGNKVCNPPFESSMWYKTGKKDTIEYNEVMYQPMGWDYACRFVAMRIPKEDSKSEQAQLCHFTILLSPILPADHPLVSIALEISDLKYVRFETNCKPFTSEGHESKHLPLNLQT